MSEREVSGHSSGAPASQGDHPAESAQPSEAWQRMKQRKTQLRRRAAPQRALPELSSQDPKTMSFVERIRAAVAQGYREGAADRSTEEIRQDFIDLGKRVEIAVRAHDGTAIAEEMSNLGVLREELAELVVERRALVEHRSSVPHLEKLLQSMEMLQSAGGDAQDGNSTFDKGVDEHAKELEAAFRAAPSWERYVQLRESRKGRTWDLKHRHVVRAGETLESLAKQFYGNPGEWDLIADANQLGSPTLVPGVELVVPSAQRGRK